MANVGGGNDAGLLVLISLASGPKHGHAMLLDIERFAHVRLGPGTLYGALTRLEELGEIEPMPAEGRRRPYRLSDAGRRTLEQRLGSLGLAVQTGLARIAS